MSEEKVVSQEKISEADRMELELAKVNRRLALANAEKAVAQNESADLAYKYVVLKLYRKYGLSDEDALNENGDILRGAAAQAPAVPQG
jgi:hypothetical protein